MIIKNNRDKLWEFEKNCHGLGITWQMIYQIVDTYLKTGQHDSTLYPTFEVKKYLDDVLEIRNKLCDQYTYVTTFDHYNWQSFHITKQDKEKMDEKNFKDFVEWFRNGVLNNWDVKS